MSDDSLIVLALIVTVFGMSSFALSISAHWKQILGARQQAARTRIALRVVGSVLLGGTFILCNFADPFMMAILVWPMLLLVGAGIVAGGLTLHAQTRRGKETGL